jgi:thiamine biosynthesis lipoprotein
MRAIGTSASVAVTAPDRADRALALLAEGLRVLDEACSRFRADSELRRLERLGHGRPTRVSRLLFEVLEVSCVVAVETAGAVDPTVASAVSALGYDRHFEEINQGVSVPEASPRPAPGWWRIVLDPVARTAVIPPGLRVDIGATGKALAADRCAARIADELGCGVLVNLGGDVSVAGRPPDAGWSVGIAPLCTTPTDEVDQVVAITAGGLATSGTTARAWVRNGRSVHHIVDPQTGEAAEPVWSLVSTTAPTCVEANALSTAAVVWGEDAVGNLDARGVPARLVRRATGEVVCRGGWPTVAGGGS